MLKGIYNNFNHKNLKYTKPVSNVPTWFPQEALWNENFFP